MSNQVDYEINKELGECYLFMGEFDKAKEYYRKAIASEPKNADPFLGLAAIALSIGDMDDAYTLYKKANELQSSDKSLAGMGMIEVEKQNFEEAFIHYTAALDANPVNMVAINGLVQLCHYQARLDEAIPYLEAALAIKNDEAIRFALAGSLLSLGRESESRAHLEVLLGENPTNSEAQQLYAHFAA